MRRASTLLILSSCFAVLVFGMQLHANFENWMTTWGQGLQINAYIQNSDDEQNIQKMKLEIEKLESVAQVQIVTAEESFHEFKTQMAGLAPVSFKLEDLIEAIPKSLLVTLKSDANSSNTALAIGQTAENIKKISGVDSVEYGQSWIQQFSEFIQGFQTLWFSLGIILCIMVGFMIFNSIQVMILERKSEIEILELLGADPHFIQKPFLVEGIVLGLASASFALAVNFVVFEIIRKLMSRNSVMVFMASHVQNIKWATIAEILVFGLVFGLVSAYFGVRKINTGWSAAAST